MYVDYFRSVIHLAIADMKQARLRVKKVESVKVTEQQKPICQTIKEATFTHQQNISFWIWQTKKFSNLEKKRNQQLQRVGSRSYQQNIKMGKNWKALILLFICDKKYRKLSG